MVLTNLHSSVKKSIQPISISKYYISEPSNKIPVFFVWKWAESLEITESYNGLFEQQFHWSPNFEKKKQC